MNRPDPLRWLWYALGGGLAPRFNEWVLHDTTGSTWVVRHVARSLVQLSIPIAAVLLFLPAPLGLRVLTALAAGGSAMMYMIVHTLATTDRRLIRAGYPGGTGEKVRGERATAAQRTSNADRRERIAARRHGRR
ncbi:MAG: hypothetical protein QOH52_4285 [Pseudonocardiales bacterium]|jgi:hypothetical protein|nr:hypothetical protein [Pseudonocardiales bacterium]